MKTSFGMIVKDGMPFIKYSIDSVRMVADEIIVIDGGSIDGTVEWCKAQDDIQLVQGNWDDKTEQSNEYLKRAVGDWVWQLDSDEVYDESGLEVAMEVLEQTKAEMINLPIINFWHDLRTRVIGGLWDMPIRRIYRHKPGDVFVHHRPPILQRASCFVVPNTGFIIESCPVYHYSYLGNDRVKRKS